MSAFVPPPDNHRLRVLHAEPLQVNTEEVKHMAEELYDLRKNAGVKTLRDEFAMAALTAFVARPIVAADRKRALVNMGRDAYTLADAMMEARQK